MKRKSNDLKNNSFPLQEHNLNEKISRKKLNGTLLNSSLNHYSQLTDVFKNLDLSTFPNISPNAPPDVIANYIIENPQMFKKVEKRKTGVDEDRLEPTMVDLTNIQSTSNVNLLSEFMERFNHFFESECHANCKENMLFNKEVANRLIHQEFPHCRTVLIEHLVAEFNGRYSIIAAICFFVESKFPHLVRKFFLHVEDSEWNSMVSLLPVPRKRRKTWIEIPKEGTLCDSFNKFQNFLTESKINFPELFKNNFLSEDAEKILMKQKLFTCSVCFDEFPINTAIMCSASEIVDLFPTEHLPSTSVLNDKKENGPHQFCLECLRGQALAATTEMPLAEGGVGLKCMESNCQNPILFSKFRSLIPYRIRKLLNERIIEEVLGMANLENLERCKRCNYAVEFEIPKDVVKVFSCFKCGFEYCRICERDWNDKHFGVRCEELDKDDKVNREARKLEEMMSNALIRKCHKCNVPFVKWDGCNHMRCRCGVSQCYKCRAPNVTYKHFCQHFREPRKKSCTKCKKSCLLWENVDNQINKEVEEMRKKAQQLGFKIG